MERENYLSSICIMWDDKIKLDMISSIQENVHRLIPHEYPTME